MTDIDKSLGLRNINDVQVIDVAPTRNEVKPYVPQTTTEEDFDYARSNLKEVIDKGGEALQQLIDIADQSQHPRAYEVIATLMNTLVGANKDLMDLSKKKKDIMAADKKEGPQTINNNLILTTAELQKMLTAKKE
jgi:hypothetical protein